MVGNTKQMRAPECIQPTFSDVQTEIERGKCETTYWGILCRTCRDLVAFDTCPYVSFGPGASGMQPGAIRCAQGHNHIYFPRDFHFVSSEAPVLELSMQQNRDAYRAINPVAPADSYR